MKKLLYLIFLLLVFLSCHAQQNISDNTQKLSKIIYCSYGGRLGWQESLIITQDSLIYSSLVAMSKEGHKIQKTISKNIWEELASSFNLKAFKSIQNGSSRLPIDGMDKRYTVILKSGKEYSFINGKNTNKNKKAILFLEKITTVKNNIIEK